MAYTRSEGDLPVDPLMRREVIENLAARLRDLYVFPDAGQRMAQHILDRLGNGDYDEIVSASALCETLTNDMRAISRDLHLRLRYSVDPQAIETEEDISEHPQYIEEYRQEAMLENFGYRRVERLPGNVGYVEQVGLHDAQFASETAIAAMQLVAHTDALIIDLRANGGGDPRHVALICSYLVPDKPIHLNSFYSRETDRVEQFWTLPYVPGKRYLDKPVYVLTSRRTFSGAEELAYNLKQLKRATIVGETTGGGAHPVRLYRLSAHFSVSIPFARAVNPISGTNWEGAGVEPDIAVDPEDALRTAHVLALRSILDRPTALLGTVRAAQEREVHAALAELDTATSPA